MFWERINKACERCGIKLTPLLKEMSISTGSISRWKSGTVPNGETLTILADRLGVSVDYLLGRTENEIAPPQTVEELSDYERHIIELLRQAPQGTDAAILQLLQLRSADGQ